MPEMLVLKIAAPAETANIVAHISDRTAKRRRGGGRPFSAGQSGNPGGRPKRTPEQLDLIAACKARTPEALAVIEELMATSRNDRVRMDAALAIVERAYGKPTQPTSIAGHDGGPLRVEAVQRTDYHALRLTLAARCKIGT